MVVTVNAAIPGAPSVPLTDPETGICSDPWYNFFQLLFKRTGGSTGNASNILDEIGDIRGGMLARFEEQWLEFVASVANTIPVMNPLADVELKTASELLDLIGALPGKGLFRNALAWQQGPLISDAVAAAGAAQVTATALAAQWNQVITVGAGTGVRLFQLGAGTENVVWNSGANALKIYPAAGSEIDSLGVNAPYVLAVTKTQVFRQLTATAWRSTQLG